VVEIRRLKQLEEENTKVKRLVPDLNLEKASCRMCSDKKFYHDQAQGSSNQPRTLAIQTGSRYAPYRNLSVQNTVSSSADFRGLTQNYRMAETRNTAQNTGPSGKSHHAATSVDKALSQKVVCFRLAI